MLREGFNQTLFQFISDTNKTTYHLSKDHKPRGLTPMQYSLLEHLYFQDGNTISEISKNLCLNVPNVSREAKKLISRELIYKVQSTSDRRKSNVFLTKEGKTLLDECFFQVIIDVNKKYEHLTKQELFNLTECMKYIMRKMYLR